MAQVTAQTGISTVNAAEREQLKIVIVGHVDHGKSTLVGRLLHDTNTLPDGKVEAIKASCEKRGMPFEWSFLMDALQTERDQGITIDTTQIWLRLPDYKDKLARDVVIIDAPGHKEFLKNMVTGAAQADAALVIIDAKEGVREQSKRHGYLLHLLGVRQIAVIVNKMDAVGYKQSVFDAIETEYREYLGSLGVTPTCFIPISAREGDGIIGNSDNMTWFKAQNVIDTLHHFTPSGSDEALSLRFPVQDVYKFDDRRIIAGRIESGSLKVGDRLVFSPSGAEANIASLEQWPQLADGELADTAYAGQSIGVTLDQPIFVERGQIASHKADAPIITNSFRARIFWLGTEPLVKNKRYLIKLGTTEIQAELRQIHHVIDSDTLGELAADEVQRNQVAEVTIRARGLVAVDDFTKNAQLGRFVILQDYDVAGGGTISLDGVFDQREMQTRKVKSQNITGVDFGVSPERRALTNGHMGGVLWFTGLSGSGKSTLAKKLQKRLFDKGYQVFGLDGDNIRKGLNRDLGFSPEDRTENIRRVGEVAGLFAQSGTIVICSFISPYHEDRQHVRAIAPEFFHNVYVKASLEVCEKRDVKGLYQKARSGEIPEFTGISAPYEEPTDPDVVVDTEVQNVEQSVQILLDYVERQLVDPLNEVSIDSDYYAGTGI